MKKAMRLRPTLLWAVVAAVFGACANEKEIGPAPSLNNMITFQASVPVNRAAALSRALSYADEYAVQTVDMLVFQNGKYLYTTAGTIIAEPVATSPTGNATMTFRAPMATSSSASELMVVANARAIIAAAYKSGIPAGTAQADVEQALLMALPEKGWGADPSAADYRSMPMWGSLKGQTVNESYGSTSHAMSMVRMLARVDVQVAVPAATLQLQSVRIYNYAASGRLIPAGSVWGVGSPDLAGYTDPSLPRDYAPATGYLEYTAAAQSLAGSIYLFEAPRGVAPASGNTYMKNPCIVIGGKYNGSSSTSYYRIDFVRRNATTPVSYTYLPILRNNSYTVKIDQVAGPGYPTPEQAYGSIPADMATTIPNWVDNDFTGIASDGVDILGVSSGRFTLTGGEHKASEPSAVTDNLLTIVTDAPGGWTATVYGDLTGTTGASWLTLAPLGGTGSPVSILSGGGNYPDGNMVRLVMSTTPVARTAYIHVKAGKLTYVVKVTQSAAFVRITNSAGTDISALDFNSKTPGVAPAAQTFRVLWEPASLPLSVAKTTLSGVDAPFGWQNVNTNALTALPAGGSYTFTIDPAAITTDNVNDDPFYTRGSSLIFTMSGLNLKDEISLKQTHYNIVVTGLTNGEGITAGKATVKSNTNWALTIDDPDGILSNASAIPKSGVANITTGAMFDYKFSGVAGSAKFVFTSPGNLFEAKEIYITGGPAVP